MNGNEDNGSSLPRDSQPSFIERTRDRYRKVTIRSRIIYVTIFYVIIVAAVLSFVTLAIDPSTFTDPAKRSAWVLRTAITAGLSAYGVIALEIIHSDMLKGKENGKYQTELSRYREVREKAVGKEYDFPEWKSLHDTESLQQKKIDFLRKDDCEKPEMVLKYIDQIENPYLLCDHIEGVGKNATEVKGIPLKVRDRDTGEEFIITRKTPQQVRDILDIRKGRITIYPYEAQYYLSIDSFEVNTTDVDKADALHKAKAENQRFSRFWKIFTVVAVQVFWGLVTVEDVMNLTSIEAWFLFISRLTALIGGGVAGMMTSDKDVRFDTDMVRDRRDMLAKYLSALETGKFVPQTYEEKAKKEEEEYERRRSQHSDSESADTGRPESGPELDTEGNAECTDRKGLECRQNQDLSVERL